LTQEAALEEVRQADILELKNAVAATQSVLSEWPREGAVYLAVEVAGLRSSLAAVERENICLASELAAVASAVSVVRERQESEASRQRELEGGLQRQTQEEVYRLEGELRQFGEKRGQLTQEIAALREA
jgi:hypothetical protein